MHELCARCKFEILSLWQNDKTLVGSKHASIKVISLRIGLNSHMTTFLAFALAFLCLYESYCHVDPFERLKATCISFVRDVDTLLRANKLIFSFRWHQKLSKWRWRRMRLTWESLTGKMKNQQQLNWIQRTINGNYFVL